ncbi:MAG: DoxX family protein [Anaerolineales bacterium]|nr:DoxX family protein [Anaerolineales bacterium]
MHGLEWVFSTVLVAAFFIMGLIRVFRYEKARDLFPWVRAVPRGLAQVIGAAEILGALGLILPAATNIYPWLTPLAAVALAVLMVLAAGFNILRQEKEEAGLSLLLLIMLALVAYLRWQLMP